MGLKEQMDEDRKALEEALKAEAGADEVLEETPTTDDPEPEQKAEEPVKDETPEEPKAEEKKEEPKVEAKEERDDGSQRRARLARERDAYKKQVEELQEKLAVASAPKATEESPKQDSYIDSVLQEVVQEHTVSRAQRGFEIAESEFIQRNPEYIDVSKQYWTAMAASVKLQNPRMSNVQVNEATKNYILNIAEGYAQKGLNPAEEMYHDAVDLGFKARKDEPEPEEKPELKPDLSKVAANRARNAGMAAAKGRGASAVMTKQYAATELTTAEWAKIPKAERERLLYGDV
jgi:hypothetical protein